MLFRASTPTMPFPEMDGQQPPFASMFQTSGGMCSHVAASGATQHGSACNASSTNGYRGRVLYIPGLASVLTFCTQGGSPVPKSGPLGSVRGAGSNACPYRENAKQSSKRKMHRSTRRRFRGRLVRLGDRAKRLSRCVVLGARRRDDDCSAPVSRGTGEALDLGVLCAPGGCVSVQQAGTIERPSRCAADREEFLDDARGGIT